MVTHATADIEAAHAAVERAICAGDPKGLRVLGYGEMTLVVGWPTEAPALALKRLPPFSSRARLAAYATLVDDYAGALRERGVGVVETELAVIESPGGGLFGYLVQPMVPAERVLDAFLATAEEAAGRRHLEAIARAVCAAADERVGIDGQVANWALGDDGPLLFDLTTPLLRDDGGRERIDASLFTSVYPWLVRGALRRFVAPGVMASFHDPRAILTDAASNLMRQNLDRWVPVLLAAANARLDRPITPGEVLRYYRGDTRLWSLTERLRRTDRWWQRRVRRRPYPMLLAPPGGIRPPRRAEGESR